MNQQGSDNVNENESFIHEDEPGRKTLTQQVKESKQIKELEYRKQLESQNSSYKLDDRSVRYYHELKQQEAQMHRLEREREMNQVARFRLKKTQNSIKKPVSNTPSPKKYVITRRLKESIDTSSSLDQSEPNSPSTLSSTESQTSRSTSVPDEEQPKSREKIHEKSHEKDHKINFNTPRDSNPNKLSNSIITGYSSDSNSSSSD